MTYEEAIKRIKQFGLYHAIDDLPNSILTVQAFDMAIEALEKQIPKKPIVDNENGVYEKEHCPTCRRSLFPYDHHCPCGQAIDWSDLK